MQESLEDCKGQLKSGNVKKSQTKQAKADLRRDVRAIHLCGSDVPAPGIHSTDKRRYATVAELSSLTARTKSGSGGPSVELYVTTLVAFKPARLC